MGENQVEWGNPAALGLAGFGLTTTALSLYNMGVIGTASYTLSYGFMYGGLAQVIAGIIEFRRNNTFGGTAFTSYGLFWLGLALLSVFESPVVGVYPASSKGEFASWMVLWGIFTLYMAIGAYVLRARAVTVVLGLLTILFFLLAAAQFTGGTLLKIAGGWGVATGLSAVYTSAAIIINTSTGRTVLPE